MNFQGYLTDIYGTPLNAMIPMRFGLYTGTTRIWYAEYSQVKIEKGNFSVYLGATAQQGAALDPTSGNPLPASFLPLSSDLLSGVDSSVGVSVELEVGSGSTFETVSPKFNIATTLFAL
jgi:hypothetical protein